MFDGDFVSCVLTSPDLTNRLDGCGRNRVQIWSLYTDLKAMLEEEYENKDLVKLVRKHVNVVQPRTKRRRTVRNPMGDMDATQDEDEENARADFAEQYGCVDEEEKDGGDGVLGAQSVESVGY